MAADKYSALWISHSSLNDFLQCARAYYLKNIYRDPKTNHKIKIMSPPLALGQAVHEVIESLSVLPVEKRFSEPLMEKFEKAWEKVTGKKGGFAGGIIGGLLVSFALFGATLKLPVYYAFRTTTILLILFAAGLLARGVHEFAEAGVISEVGQFTLPLLPAKGTFASDMIKAIFGVTQQMDLVQLALYTGYIAFMFWYVFLRNRAVSNEQV